MNAALVLLLSPLLAAAGDDATAVIPPAPPERAPAADPLAHPLTQAAQIVEAGPNTTANLEEAIALYEEALRTPPTGERADRQRRAKAYTDIARARLRLGDLAQKPADKIAHYEKGRAAAAAAQKHDPDHADAYFWDAANMATIGRTRGIMNSLFMVDDLKAKLEKSLALDPNHHYARETMASIYHAVPGILGGDDDKAEELYREVLRRDPHFTPTKVTFAQFLLERGEHDEARRLLREVAHGKRSSVPNDWKKFNRPEALKLLSRLENDR